uniref:ATP synthase complex subunit 8 n=1 Tax=Stygobromus indentatus TaxID=1678292 RepID=A0A172QHB7_9CRUS|nr:ATP synthase F0 subunit 8 [Stygobromus indentatus]AND97082.1 ATP synthase F0 subunit 8 [Stygobromus indentatus]
MPQMAPIMWLSIFSIILMIILSIQMYNHFMINKITKSPLLTLSNEYNNKSLLNLWPFY